MYTVNLYTIKEKYDEKIAMFAKLRKFAHFCDVIEKQLGNDD